jgi:hypothetical protein
MDARVKPAHDDSLQTDMKPDRLSQALPSPHELRMIRPRAGTREMRMAVKTYTGGCHCGQVRYETTADLAQVISCNCSICSKRGALWTFVSPESFALRSGEEVLSDYQFNQRVIHHLFCSVCGIESFARGKLPDGSDMVAVNVRCLDDINIAALTLTPYDGRSI